MRRILAIVVVAGCAALAACQSPAYNFIPSAAQVAAAAKPPVIHLSLPAIGLYENGEPDTYYQVAKFSADTKTPVRIAMYYQDWGFGFHTAFAVEAARHDAVTDVMLQPTGVSVASIADGRQDAFLTSYAKAIKAFGDPVIISFGHEMNGCWYTWGTCKTPPKTFVKAWRHMVTLFRKLKVGNVKWLWEANGTPVGPLRSEYPGNAYVNYVGVTGYYVFPSTTFQSAFQQAITAIRQFSDRPLVIGESGVEPGDFRDQQLAELFSSARIDHVQAIIYFDVSQKNGNAYRQNWRLEGDQSALQEFRLAAKRYLASK